MELANIYPSPSDLVGREVEVLNFLRNSPYITETHSPFALDAEKYYKRNKNTNAGFEFFSYLDVSHAQKKTSAKAKPNLRLIVAARIDRNAESYSNVSYCLAVCRTRTLTVLRKFHFDVTMSAGSGGTRWQSHPSCHIQYCGKMIPQMEEMGVRPTQLDTLSPWLSEPRIFAWPMSLALLVDMTLHEFPSPRSEKFRAEPEWRAIIRTHETIILTPFFQKCVDVLRSHDKNRATLAEAFYVI
jgi:hypothetical protein